LASQQAMPIPSRLLSDLVFEYPLRVNSGYNRGTMWENPKRVEAAIRRLTREIEEIDIHFYRTHETEDRALFAGMLERKRDDMVRGAVIQLHTGIEDLLDQLIAFAITGGTLRRVRSESSRALRSVLVGGGSIGFDRKVALAVALRVITTKTKNRLQVLNTLRNKCSHNWLLKIPVRYGKRPAQKKPPLLLYEGRDLHTVTVLKDFIAEFGGGIYLRLFSRYMDLI
jgi:hypothetical protein